MRPATRCLPLLLLGLLAAACSSSGPTEPLGDPTGVYTLRSINGQTLPFVWQRIGDDTVEFLDGTVTLGADRTFIDATTFRVTEGGVVRNEVDQGNGAWSIAGATVRFVLGDGSSYTMTWDGGDVLTQVVENLTLRYQR